MRKKINLILWLGFILSLEGCAVMPFLHEPHIKATPPEQGLPKGSQDYSGIFHVHTFHSHHSTGTFEGAVAAAQRVHADFVVITDHDTLLGREEKKEGLFGNVLMLIGAELTTPAGHLGVMGIEKEIDHQQDIETILKDVETQEGQSFICHAHLRLNPWTDWTVMDHVTGMEVFNLPATIYEDGFIKTSVKSLFMAQHSFMNTFVNRSDSLMAKWDEILAQRKFVGIASVDAHERYRILGWTLDSYDAMFEVVQTHVYAEELSRQAIFAAFKKGHVYIGFDIVKPIRNFLFSAKSSKKTVIMGDEIQYEKDLQLSVLPLLDPADIRVLKDGKLWKSQLGTSWEGLADGPGVYRVEVYLKNKLWIISNPIYVR